MEPRGVRPGILQEDPNGDTVAARLSRPLTRWDAVQYTAFFGPLVAGAILGQFWTPGFGLGLFVCGALGLALNAILMKPWMRKLLGRHANRIVALVVMALGAAMAWLGIAPGGDR